jgi:hypothetical protein
MATPHFHMQSLLDEDIAFKSQLPNYRSEIRSTYVGIPHFLELYISVFFSFLLPSFLRILFMDS